MPLFSIVTVTLNPPLDDLRRTLESVLGQNFDDWELIVKDGGSHDGVFECLPDESRIRMHLQSDSGIFDAMNQALGYVKGEYVCFLNAGDKFFGDSVLSAIAALVKGEPALDFVYGDVCKPQSRSGFERYPSRFSRYFLYTQMVCHQAWFVRRTYYSSGQMYETEGPNGKNPTGADYRFLLRMILRDRVKYRHIPEVLISYQGGGLSAQPVSQADSKRWRNEQRKKLFKSHERIFFNFAWWIRKAVKSLVYDHFLHPVWRRIQGRRFGDVDLR